MRSNANPMNILPVDGHAMDVVLAKQVVVQIHRFTAFHTDVGYGAGVSRQETGIQKTPGRSFTFEVQ